MHWHRLDHLRPDRSEAMLAAWVQHSTQRVEPYWLLAHAMGYPGFDNPARHLFPIMVERTVASPHPSQFELQRQPASYLATLIGQLGHGIERFQLDAPRTGGHQNITFDFNVAAPRKGGTIRFLAAIDDGFPFAHPNLLQLDASGERILWPRIWSLWNQGGQAGHHWDSRGLPFGAELRLGAMRSLMGAQLSALDEAEVYRQTRYKLHASTAPHGSGVTHLLAGRTTKLPDGSRCDMPGSWPWPVLAVQLPEPAIEDTAGAWLGFYALHALRHLVQRVSHIARRCGKRWHLVVNVSYGSLAGPHDGSSMFEQAMDLLVASLPADRARLDIVLAAGNARALPVHAVRTLAQDACGRYRCDVPPDNPRESYVEFWLPAEDDGGQRVAPSSFTFRVQAPDGSIRTVVPGSAHLVRTSAGAPPCGGVVFPHCVAQGLHGTMVLLMLRPTRAGVMADRAPAGIWTVEVSHQHAGDVTVRAWVERNDMIGRNRRAQQVRFVADPCVPEHISSNASLSHCAYGKHVIVAGAVRQSDSWVAAYSGRGRTAAGMKRPDWFAPSDLNAAVAGVLVPGWREGQWTRMAGTSIATPWVARWIAAGEPPGQRGPTFDEREPIDMIGPPSYLTVRSD